MLTHEENCKGEEEKKAQSAENEKTKIVEVKREHYEFICQVCDKTFSREAWFTKHQKKCVGELKQST